MPRKMVQAYHQAPWRLQIQNMGAYLIVIVVIAVMVMLRLVIMAQAATTGLNLRDDEYTREELLRTVSSLKITLGELTAVSAMEKRAIAAGFKPLKANTGMYVLVNGYTGRPQVSLAPPPGPDLLPNRLLRPEYTNSLWELVFQTANDLKLSQKGPQP